MSNPGPDPDGRDQPPEIQRGDDRPGVRVAMAASLLRRGRAPVRVADITAVPLAMVELIADELADAETTMNTHTPTSTAPVSADRIRGGATPPVHARAVPGRLRVALSATVFVAVIMNLGLAISSMVWHLPVLGLVSMLATAPLFAVLLLISIARTRPGRRSPRPRRWPRQGAPGNECG